MYTTMIMACDCIASCTVYKCPFFPLFFFTLLSYFTLEDVAAGKLVLQSVLDGMVILLNQIRYMWWGLASILEKKPLTWPPASNQLIRSFRCQIVIQSGYNQSCSLLAVISCCWRLRLLRCCVVRGVCSVKLYRISSTFIINCGRDYNS